MVHGSLLRCTANPNKLPLMSLESPDNNFALPEPVIPVRPARNPWTLYDLSLFVAFFIFAMLATAFAAFAGYAALRPIMGWRPSMLSMTRNTPFLLGIQLAFYILLFIYIYLLVVHRYGQKFSEGIKWRGLTRVQMVKYVALGVVITVVVQIFPTFLPDKTSFPLERMFASPESAYALAAFAVLVGPFMEELIFRGVLFSIFEKRAGVRFAIVSTAVLFGAMHIPEYRGAWDHIFLIFLVGLVLSLTRGLTDSLTPSVVLHVTYNACLMTAAFFATHHFRVMPSLLLR